MRRSLWAAQPRWQRRLARARWVLLCLDFDGTLTPIAGHPSRVRLPKALARRLAAVARRDDATVALVSGRALRDLKARAAVPGAYYAGNHGLELEGPGVRYVHPVARRMRPQLRRLAGALARAVRGIAGAWVEDKILTLSVHWRRTPAARRGRVRRLVRRLTEPLVRRGLVRVTRGKCVLDIRPPVAWGKGEAVAWLWKRLRRPERPSLAVYLGDDRTDEEAFRVINRLGGLSILVGPPAGRSAARCRLRGPSDVAKWTQALRRPWTR